MNKKKADIHEIYENNANHIKLIIMFLLSVVVLTIATQGAFSFKQMGLVAYLFPEMGVLALGMMLAMISGGIDLTVVAVADLSGILSCMFMKMIMPASASVAVQVVVYF